MYKMYEVKLKLQKKMFKFKEENKPTRMSP